MKYLSTIFLFIILSSCREDKKVIELDIHIKNHFFNPSVISIKKDQVLKLIIYNDDPTVEEFESFDLKREKIVPANGKIIITVGPLKNGTYKFFGEFNMKTAKGKIIVE